MTTYYKRNNPAPIYYDPANPVKMRRAVEEYGADILNWYEADGMTCLQLGDGKDGRNRSIIIMPHDGGIGYELWCCWLEREDKGGRQEWARWNAVHDPRASRDRDLAIAYAVDMAVKWGNPALALKNQRWGMQPVSSSMVSRARAIDKYLHTGKAAASAVQGCNCTRGAAAVLNYWICRAAVQRAKQA